MIRIRAIIFGLLAVSALIMGYSPNEISSDVPTTSAPFQELYRQGIDRHNGTIQPMNSTIVMAQPSILGRWNTGQENTVIEIKEVAGKIEGKIVTSDHTKVPIGRLILKDVYRVNQNFKGKLYSLRKNKWFDAEFSPKQEKIEVAITVGWVTREINWKKIY